MEFDSSSVARAIVGTFIVLVASGCAVEQKTKGRPNVVLVSIDTLRADHLGAYGYRPPTSPHLDGLARQGIVFENVSAQAPSTLLSHASIFTSQIPQHHAASHIRFRPLAESAVTLTERLAEAGYDTASFNSGGQLVRAFGLAQGFAIYDQGPDSFSGPLERSLAWLEERRNRADQDPFFLFLHTYEVHHPYTPRPADLQVFAGHYRGTLPDQISVELLDRLNHAGQPPSAEDLAHIVAAYDAEILSVDRGIGRLVEYFERRDLLDVTLWVVTSDHGEEFGEHGLVGWHSHTLYEELLRVPLILRLPEALWAGRRVASRVASIDIAPTLLDLLGLPPAPTFEGRSLAPLFAPDGRLPPAPAIAFRDGPQGQIYEALTWRRFKLNEGRLFDLAADPGEKADLAGLRPDLLEPLRGELRRRVDRSTDSSPSSGPALLDEDDRKRLLSLGYTAGPSNGVDSHEERR